MCCWSWTTVTSTRSRASSSCPNSGPLPPASMLWCFARTTLHQEVRLYLLLVLGCLRGTHNLRLLCNRCLALLQRWLLLLMQHMLEAMCRCHFAMCTTPVSRHLLCTFAQGAMCLAVPYLPLTCSQLASHPAIAVVTSSNNCARQAHGALHTPCF